ncbi:polyphosphate kinase 2 [Rhizobium helianthi]|uniref:ADP/GDP-polyphosphate phosphotransferase n=1 Tax=Rhizobium helianthi TaxID=1132695 RepID=A0ABW4M4Z8_9HYPH
MTHSGESRAVELDIGGSLRVFDIDDPKLPDWVEDTALTSGGFPYKKKMKSEQYEAELEALQIELVKAQLSMRQTGQRIMALFEGRDAAGKGGSIFTIHGALNPRYARVVALTRPTETEAGQWYFQRYVTHFPTKGEMVLFDRSWYNRAGVEPVMGFCSPQEHKHFLKMTPSFEQLIVDEGIHFFKFWLNIGREMQLKRFHDRRHDPLKIWKLSSMDIAALTKWKDYTQMRDLMLEKTHTKIAPWTIVRANDKRRARLNIIRHILNSIDYEGKDKKAIGDIDDSILSVGREALK